MATPNFKKDFIARMVKSPNWGREMKILNSLVEECPEPNFWNTLSLDFTLNSLAFFKTDKGSDLLRSKYLDYKAFLNRTSQNTKSTL